MQLSLAQQATLGHTARVGAWGAGNFENDQALDWLYTVRTSEDSDAVVAGEIRRAIDNPDYLDSIGGAGCRLITAAELLAAAGGDVHPRLRLMTEDREWIASKPLRFDAELAHVARTVLNTLVDPERCELAALWVLESHAPPDREGLDAVQQIATRLDRLLGREPRKVPAVVLTRYTIEAGRVTAAAGARQRSAQTLRTTLSGRSDSR